MECFGQRDPEAGPAGTDPSPTAYWFPAWQAAKKPVFGAIFAINTFSEAAPEAGFPLLTHVILFPNSDFLRRLLELVPLFDLQVSIDENG